MENHVDQEVIIPIGSMKDCVDLMHESFEIYPLYDEVIPEKWLLNLDEEAKKFDFEKAEMEQAVFSE